MGLVDLVVVVGEVIGFRLVIGNGERGCRMGVGEDLEDLVVDGDGRRTRFYCIIV